MGMTAFRSLRRVSILALALLGGLWAAPAGKPANADPKSFPKVAPSFWNMRFKTLAGDSVRMDSLRGKYVLLNFWGEWCPKCQEEIPFLARQDRKYSGRGLRIVGFLKSVDRAKAEKLLRANGAAWTQLESNDAVESLFGVGKFPTNLLLSPEGEIVMQGFSNHWQEYKRRMDALGGGSAIKQADISRPAP